MALFDMFRRASKTPDAITGSLAESGMGNSGEWMGPGRPLNPVLGYSQRPRAMDYPVAANVHTSGRGAWGRTPYDTLKSIIDSYDVARMAINHKIDEIRSMEPMFSAADGVSGDVSGAIEAAVAALASPDRESPYDEWVSKLLEGALRYDATALYRRRNLAGDVMALEILDGTTIEPLIDEHGRRPLPPSPAYFQRLKGQVGVWLTSDDVEFRRFRPQTDSPYGLAPMESILLTANTDLLFQWHFLQTFTDGSIPAGFMTMPPDLSSPDQVAEWQDFWDATVLGDQSKKHQLIAVPAGSVFTATKPETFDATFPEYLMSRVCAAFGVTPQDIGIVKDVNRANGETQVDIQFRVNTLPWVRWVEGILTRYVQHDLGLPVQVNLNTGRDVEDRVAEAQAWKIGVDGGAVSRDEWRQDVYGLPIDNENPMQRSVTSSRAGVIPLSAIAAVQGPTDPETYGPLAGAPLPHKPFTPIEGVAPQKPSDAPPLAVVRYPAENASSVAAVEVAEAAPVTKAVDERAAFARFVKAQAKAGKWRRDFAFTALPAVEAHRMNDAGRASVRKAAGQIVAAGLCVKATDTGRVLMLQRGLDPTDDAAGYWEFPGGGVEAGEDSFAAASREWVEETALDVPVGSVTGTWTASNGVYVGYVWTIDSEDQVDLLDRAEGMNPDDPDGDLVESIAWWDPAQLWGNPALRPELATDLALVFPRLETVEPGDDHYAEAPTTAGGTLEGDIASKQGEPDPPVAGGYYTESDIRAFSAARDVVKASDPRWSAHPARKVEGTLTAAHAPAIQAAIAGQVTPAQLRALAAKYVADRDA